MDLDETVFPPWMKRCSRDRIFRRYLFIYYELLFFFAFFVSISIP